MADVFLVAEAASRQSAERTRVEGCGMQLLAICRRRTEAFGPDAFDALLDAEAESVRKLYAGGFIRYAWSREDMDGACLLLEAATLDDAHAQLRALPLVAQDMLEVQLIPLRGYRGFGPRT